MSYLPLTNPDQYGLEVMELRRKLAYGGKDAKTGKLGWEALAEAILSQNAAALKAGSVSTEEVLGIVDATYTVLEGMNRLFAREVTWPAVKAAQSAQAGGVSVLGRLELPLRQRVLAHVQNIVAAFMRMPQLPADQVVRLMDLPTMGKDAKACAFVRSIDSQVHWLEFVSQVQSQQPRFYDPHKPEPLDHQVRVYFYTAGQQASNVCRLLDRLLQEQRGGQQLPNLINGRRSDVSPVYGVYAEAQDRLTKLRETWVTGDGQLVAQELDQRRLDDLNARIFAAQAEHMQGGTALALTVGTDAQPGSTPDYTPWQQVPQPKRASPGFTHDALELQQQAVRSLRATQQQKEINVGLLPLYAAVCAGRLHPSSPAGGYSGDAPDPTTVPTPEEVTGRSLRIMSGLWLDEALDAAPQTAAPQPVIEELILKCDPAVFKEAIGEMPFWLLLVAESFYASLVDSVQDQGNQTRWEPIVQELDALYAQLNGGGSTLANLPNLPNWADVAWLQDQLGKIIPARADLDLVGATDQLLEFATVFMPAAERCGLLRDIYTVLGSVLEKPGIGRKQKISNYMELMKTMYSLGARHRCLKEAHDIDYEARSLQLLRQRLLMRPLNTEMLGSFGERTFAYFDGVGGGGGGMRTARQFYEASGTPRGAQSACLKSGHLNLQPDEVLNQASNGLAEAFGGPQGWLADVLSPSRPYLAEKFHQSEQQKRQQLVTPEECLRQPRAALASLHRQELMSRPFFWLNWYARLALAQQQGQAAPGSGFGERQLVDQMLKDGHDWIDLPARVMDEKTGLLEKSFRGKLQTGLPTLVHLWHPEDRAGWQRAWHWWMGAPAIASASPALYELMQQAQKVTSTAEFSALLKIVSGTILLRLSQLRSLLGLPIQPAAAGIRQTGSLLHSPKSKSVPSDLSGFVESVTGSMNYGSIEQSFQATYASCVRQYPQVLQPEMSMNAVVLSLLRAELDEVADAVFGILARAVAGVLAEVPADDDVPAKLDQLVETMGQDPGLSGLLRANLDWVFQLGQHICSFPGAVTVTLPLYWQEFVLGRVVGSRPGVKLQLLNGLEREFCCQPDAIRALPSRVHESAACSLDTEGSLQEDLPDRLAVSHPTWRQALSLFCDRCSHHSRQFLRDCNVLNVDTRQQIRYHEEVAEERGVGVANMSDRQLLAFAVYILIGNTSQSLSTPMDKTRAETLQNAYTILERPALHDADTLLLLLDAPERLKWADIPQETTNRSAGALVRSAAQAPAALNEYQSKLNPEFVRIVDDVVDYNNQLVGSNQLDQDSVFLALREHSQFQIQLMDRAINDPHKSNNGVVSLAGLVNDARKAHEDLAQIVATLPALDQADARYRTRYPSLHDMLFVRDVANSAVHQLQRLLVGLPGLPTKIDQQHLLVLAYQSDAATLAYAYRFLLQIVSQRGVAADQTAKHQLIEQRVQELQSESAPAGALAMQLQELTTYLAVAKAQHIADQGLWQQGKDITAEFNRRLHLAGTLTSTPEYADYAQKHAKLLQHVNADALGSEADRIESLLDENAADPADLENKLATQDPQLQDPLNQIEQFLRGINGAMSSFVKAQRKLLRELGQLGGQEFAQLETDAKQSLSQAYDPNELPKLEDDVRNSLLNRYLVMGKNTEQDLIKLAAQYQADLLDQAQTLLQTTFAFIRPFELRVEKSAKEFADKPDQLTHDRLQADAHSAIKEADNYKAAALMADFQDLESNVRPVLDTRLQALRQSIVDLQNMLVNDPGNANLQQTVNDLLAPGGPAQTTLQAIDKVVAQWELQRGDGGQFAQAISQGEAAIVDLRHRCSWAEDLLSFYTLHLKETQQAKELARDAEAFSVLVHQVHTYPVPPSIQQLERLMAGPPVPANDEQAMRTRLAELSVDLAQEISDISAQEGILSAAQNTNAPELQALQRRLLQALTDIGQLQGNTPLQQAMYNQLHPAESAYLASADNDLKDAEKHLQLLANDLKELQRVHQQFILVELPKAQQAARDQLDHFVAGSNNRLDQQEKQFNALVKPFAVAQQAAVTYDANLRALQQAKTPTGHLYPKRRESAAAGLDALARALNNPGPVDFVGLVDKVGAVIQGLEKNRDKGFKLINDFYAAVGPTEAVYDAYQALQKASYDQGSVTEGFRQTAVQEGQQFPLHELLLTKRGSTPVDGLLETGLTELDNFVRTSTTLFTDLVDLSTRVQTLQAELASSSSSSSSGVTPAERIKGRARAIYQAELALVNQHVALLHQRAEAIRRSPAGDELGLAHALATPETQMTWEQAVDGHKLVAVDARVNQEVGSMASGSAPSQSQQLAQDLAAKADAVLKSSAAGRAASVFTVGQEPGHLKSIQQQLQALDSVVSGPVDYSHERQNFIAALGQLQAEFIQDKADIDRNRAQLEARVIKERAALVGQVGSAINLFNGVNETLLADDKSAGPVPRAVWAKILKLSDIGTTYGKVWFTKSQLNPDYVRVKTNPDALDENNTKHAEILNLIGRLAFVAVQMYYYRLLEWTAAFGGVANLPVDTDLANCITWTGANYKTKWNKLVKALVKGNYLQRIAENPGAPASSIVEEVISADRSDLPVPGVLDFLDVAEKFDYPAAINDIVTEANQRGIPVLKIDPYDSVNVAASPWLAADFDLALNPPAYDPKKLAPAPGQLSPGSSGRKKPVKFYDDAHPLDYTGVDKTDMFNFFTRSPETQGAGPAIFTDAWVGFWASKAPFGPGAKIGNADAAAAITAISKMNAKTKPEQNARLGFLYVAYLKFVEAQTGLAGFNPADGSFVHTVDQWLAGASKSASAYSKEVGTLIREITRACLTDLEPMYLALHNGQVDPQHPFQINTRASAFKDVALDNIRDQLVNMQNGYLYTRTLAEKYQFKDVRFYRTTVEGNRTPTRVLNSPNAKASNARATPAPIVAAESSGQDYPQIHMDPRFARAPRI